LHGGASVALAETLGSVASTLCIEDLSKKMAVGVEINANHLRSARSGFVYGKVTPIRVGRTMHVWNIEIRDEQERLVCVSRLTVAVVDVS
jgi:1,4-dihydroxy-2-naphthoyl-CoA hydrolase